MAHANSFDTYSLKCHYEILRQWHMPIHLIHSHKMPLRNITSGKDAENRYGKGFAGLAPDRSASRQLQPLAQGGQ